MKRLVTVLVVGLSLITTPAAGAHSKHTSPLPRDKQCRMEHLDRAHSTHHETVRTVRCFGRKFGVLQTALRVGYCESGLNTEKAPHSTPYHGTYQYLMSTFASQQAQIAVQVAKYQLSDQVHNMRANVGTAVIWASKHWWGPWSCY